MKPVYCKKPSGDRDIDCETEIVAQFYALVDRALKFGWAEEEVANALLSLAQTYSINLSDGAVVSDPVIPSVH